MTDAEKLKELRGLLAPDNDTDEALSAQIAAAGALVLNRLYPFGYPDGTEAPSRYERLQVQLAAELYTKKGAEGQASHSENGITRTWPAVSQLLRQIVPQVGSVTRDA